jgi:5-methylcytosine-specific restriction endonuclease McrA
MTDAQKVEALEELLSEVIHCLNMKQWDIEDPTDSHLCEIQADEYYDKMIKILHSGTEPNV